MEHVEKYKNMHAEKCKKMHNYVDNCTTCKFCWKSFKRGIFYHLELEHSREIELQLRIFPENPKENLNQDLEDLTPFQDFVINGITCVICNKSAAKNYDVLKHIKNEHAYEVELMKNDFQMLSTGAQYTENNLGELVIEVDDNELDRSFGSDKEVTQNDENIPGTNGNFDLCNFY